MACNQWIPHRLRIGFLGMTACSLLYTLRVNLSVAIVAMVDKPVFEDIHPYDWCNSYNDTTGQTEDQLGPFHWSESLQGIILGAYFYGFTATQITGGLLTQRFGAKWVCGLGIAVPAIVNALTPLAVDIHYSLLIVIRIIIGSFHGLIHSSLFSLYAKWFPIQERTIAIAATQFGGNIGAVFMTPVAGYLSKYGFADGWPSVFYTSSAVHILWLIMWFFFGHDSPKEDTTICPEEHLYILQNIECKTNKSTSPIPWKAILTSRVVYASLLAKTCGTFGYQMVSTSLPSYFNSIFNVKIIHNGIYTSLIYLAIGVTLMSAGPLSTYVIRKSRFSRTRVRKIFQMIALVGPALCLIIVPSVGCNLMAVITLIVLAMCLYGFITGGEYPIIPEFAPEFTGIVFGFANTLASSMGFLAPIIVGQILDSNTDSHNTGTREKWNLVFYITAALYIFGAVVFEIFGSARRQPWAVIEESDGSDEIEMKKTNFRIFSRRRKAVDTETPKWIEFKKTQYVY